LRYWLHRPFKRPSIGAGSQPLLSAKRTSCERSKDSLLAAYARWRIFAVTWALLAVANFREFLFPAVG
jgi:hypothetical protein